MCRCEVAQDTESRLDEDVRRCLISAAVAATSLASRFLYIRRDYVRRWSRESI